MQIGICLEKQSAAADCELYIYELYVPVAFFFSVAIEFIASGSFKGKINKLTKLAE